MDKIAKLPTKERSIYFIEASNRLNINKIMLEKDFWVCWILNAIFTNQELASHIIFKGGTSLSKCYGIIKRFSEDCDLTLDKTWLGISNDPLEESISGKERERRIDSMVNAAKEAVKEKILPILNTICQKSLEPNSAWELEIDREDKDQLTILFYYPGMRKHEGSAFGNGEYTEIELSYIKPHIRLEFGSRGGTTPLEMKNISPYIADCFKDLFIQSSIVIPTLSVERTFWEKITILHSLYHRHLHGKIIAKRMFRHYYDVYMIANSNIAKSALQQLNLLSEVVRNKSYMFKDPSSSYETAVIGSIKLVPSEEMLVVLKKDYDDMSDMIIKPLPGFEEIIKQIQILEDNINLK